MIERPQIWSMSCAPPTSPDAQFVVDLRLSIVDFRTKENAALTDLEPIRLLKSLRSKKWSDDYFSLFYEPSKFWGDATVSLVRETFKGAPVPQGLY